MLALAWFLAQALAAPSTSCVGPDIAIRHIQYLGVHGKGVDPDRVVIAADVVNVGSAPQAPRVEQHVELLKDGHVVAVEQFRPLRAGERYPVALRFFRPTNERKTPLQVIVRYVPDDEAARRENCNPGNNSVEKIF